MRWLGGGADPEAVAVSIEGDGTSAAMDANSRALHAAARARAKSANDVSPPPRSRHLSAHLSAEAIAVGMAAQLEAARPRRRSEQRRDALAMLFGRGKRGKGALAAGTSARDDAAEAALDEGSPAAPNLEQARLRSDCVRIAFGLRSDCVRIASDCF